MQVIKHEFRLERTHGLPEYDKALVLTEGTGQKMVYQDVIILVVFGSCKEKLACGNEDSTL